MRTGCELGAGGRRGGLARGDLRGRGGLLGERRPANPPRRRAKQLRAGARRRRSAELTGPASGAEHAPRAGKRGHARAKAALVQPPTRLEMLSARLHALTPETACAPARARRENRSARVLSSTGTFCAFYTTSSGGSSSARRKLNCHYVCST